MPTPPKIVRGTKGTYRVGAVLGNGGEGTVYSVNGNSSIVIKLYHDNIFDETISYKRRSYRERKLKAMLSIAFPSCRSDGRMRIAWPQDILYDNNGRCIGFTMPAVTTTFTLLRFTRNSRAKDFPKAQTWKDSVAVAFNLARITQQLHAAGVIIGDFNQNNIMVEQDGNVILIDADSFDIRDPRTGEHFPCLVGRPEYLAPEMQRKELARAVFTREADCFSLAVHIFRLLMFNYDPFPAIPCGHNAPDPASITPTHEILHGNCPYVRRIPDRTVPFHAPTFSALPDFIRALFQQTFDYTAATFDRKIRSRPTASVWADSLYDLYNSLMTPCKKDRRHLYPSHNPTCPWCTMEKGVKKIDPHRLSPCAVRFQPQPAPATGNTFRTSQTPPVTRIIPAPVAAIAPPSPVARACQYVCSIPKRFRTAVTRRKRRITGWFKKVATPPVKIHRRNAALFYIVLILMGSVGSIFFGNLLLVDHTSLQLAQVFLPILGAASGYFIARWLKDRYTCATNCIPWLLLGLPITAAGPLCAAIALILLYILQSIFGVVAGLAVGLLMITIVPLLLWKFIKHVFF